MSARHSSLPGFFRPMSPAWRFSPRERIDNTQVSMIIWPRIHLWLVWLSKTRCSTSRSVWSSFCSYILRFTRHLCSSPMNSRFWTRDMVHYHVQLFACSVFAFQVSFGKWKFESFPQSTPEPHSCAQPQIGVFLLLFPQCDSQFPITPSGVRRWNAKTARISQSGRGCPAPPRSCCMSSNLQNKRSDPQLCFVAHLWFSFYADAPMINCSLGKQLDSDACRPYSNFQVGLLSGDHRPIYMHHSHQWHGLLKLHDGWKLRRVVQFHYSNRWAFIMAHPVWIISCERDPYVLRFFCKLA